MASDTKIQDVALDYIRKHVVGGGSKWSSTTVGVLHPALVDRLHLERGELILVSAFFSDDSWYAFTTRRILSQFRGAAHSIDPSHGIRDDFGNFKGYGVDKAAGAGAVPRELATITAVDTGDVVRFEFETWQASMLPIYAARYWAVKHPAIEKLMTTSERENYRAQKG